MSLAVLGLVLLGLVDLALFAFAIYRPWRALLVLLAVLPINAFLIYIPSRAFKLGDVQRVALAGWHDALAVGIVVAAGIAYIRYLRRGRSLRPTLVDGLVAAVLVLGIFYIFVSTHRVTALYAYRTLYEPIVLMLALTVLGRTEGMPETLPRKAALAMLGGGLVGAVTVWPQVYLGGFHYLNVYYHESGQKLASAFIATGVSQPRGVATFNSPNEFAAYMALTLALILIPGVIKMRSVIRVWLAVIVSLALLLSLSRSGFLTAAFMLLVGIWLARPLLFAKPALPGRAPITAFLKRPVGVFSHCLPLVLGIVVAVVVLVSSGGGGFVGKTVTGKEPSAAGRPNSVATGVKKLQMTPLGLGLGMAGPKSSRFGEGGIKPQVNSETWYIDYMLQVGVIGLLLLMALAFAALAAMFRARKDTWGRAPIAICAGLAFGAIFIPIIDDPSTSIPLWTLVGIAICVSVKTATDGSSAEDQAAGGRWRRIKSFLPRRGNNPGAAA